VTKNLRITTYVDRALRNPEILNRLRLIPVERMHYELVRAFQHSSYESMRLLIDEYPFLGLIVLAGGKMWLKPTLEAR
jgi:hypothetical protein